MGFFRRDTSRLDYGSCGFQELGVSCWGGAHSKEYSILGQMRNLPIY